MPGRGDGRADGPGFYAAIDEPVERPRDAPSVFGDISREVVSRLAHTRRHGGQLVSDHCLLSREEIVLSAHLLHREGHLHRHLASGV